MNCKLSKTQRGITGLLILIPLAVVVVIGVIIYGYFTTSKSSDTSQNEIPRMENPLAQQTPQVGTPECPELDYTGCDTTGDFMTWTDDGIR